MEELPPIKGRDGVLLADNERLNAIDQSYPFSVNSDLEASQTAISEWLKPKGYRDFRKSWDDGFVYRAAHITEFGIDELMNNFGEFLLTFKLHPVKYYEEGLEETALTNGQTLNNYGTEIARPVIKLTGSGDTILTINGRETHLKDIQNEIVLDMNKQLIYSGNLSAWDKILSQSGQYQKPYLDVGNNGISWTGDFTATITPYWGVKI